MDKDKAKEYFELQYEVDRAMARLESWAEDQWGSDNVASGVHDVIGDFTGPYWQHSAEVHTRLHRDFNIPMFVGPCAEHPDSPPMFIGGLEDK